MTQPPAAEYIPKHIIDRWNQISSNNQSNLLKIALLRNTRAAVHTISSKLLAQKPTPGVQDLRQLQSNLELLVNRQPGDHALLDLLSDPSIAEENARDSLPGPFEPNKLDRYDRKWEKQLVTEAIHLNWRFWILDLWVDILFAETVDQSIFYQLWPNGLTLFAENASAENPIQEKDGKSLWNGRWYITASPDLEVRDFEIASIRGVSEIAKPIWTSL